MDDHQSFHHGFVPGAEGAPRDPEGWSTIESSIIPPHGYLDGRRRRSGGGSTGRETHGHRHAKRAGHASTAAR
jgi:hypothetical protein